ncbi:coatomer subunit beta [Rhizoctonia solani]|uniref:Coatomer subunit beta n=1 Tax=Rhizoctonia solani TaxID=456999 RepID=A0A8H8P295_9AGAM|nr:coatomer subunit beta [Rhizoctonia solani]QRW23055.1 coatomer subunit beta [Rhizoctonia solani]
MVLVGYLPIPNLDCEPNPKVAQQMQDKLFNDCLQDLLQPLTKAERTGMDVVCADGGVRRMYPTLSATIADFPEQCKNACTRGLGCPVCIVEPHVRGDLNPNIPLCKKIPTLNAIIKHCKEGSPNFEDWGLHNMWPWWNQHTHINIATMHMPDLLHQCHKGVFKDHLAKYMVPKLIGDKEIDKQYVLMPWHFGIRHFKCGISKLSRSTGQEAKEMMKVFLPATAGAGPKAIQATHALLKFMYLAHLSTLTNAEICKMDRQLAVFHNEKSAFKSSLKTPKGFHNIPKFHSLQHYTHSIRLLGAPNGYNTEAPERLHINLTKAGYKASNKNDDTKTEQMKEYIQRMDALALHRAYLDFKSRPEGEDNGDNWRDSWKEFELFDKETGLFYHMDGTGMDEFATKDYPQEVALDSDSDSDSDASLDDDNLEAGCMVERVVDLEQGLQVHMDGAPSQGLANEVMAYWQGTKTHYPNPKIVTAKRGGQPVTVEYLLVSHSARNLVIDISMYLKQLRPNLPTLTLQPGTKLRIWKVAQLFHLPLPFKPLEPPHVEHIRARPAKVDLIDWVQRAGQFDTVLILAYPNKIGIHCE